jgi:hypothetical protein
MQKPVFNPSNAGLIQKYQVERFCSVSARDHIDAKTRPYAIIEKCIHVENFDPRRRAKQKKLLLCKQET